VSSKSVVLALLACWAAGVAAQGGRSVKEGVYTEEQAKRGEAVYAQTCGNCHGEQMEGIDMSPALTGGTFSSNWNSLTVGDLFDRIRTTMPMDSPGSITPQQNADVIAYMLKANHYPAGKAELPSTVAPLKTITIEPPPQ
jgi:mono/diheme cytochrome c family protein